MCSQPIPRLFWRPTTAELMFSSLVCPLGFPWVRCVEFGRVSPQSLSAAFWLRTAPHCHVELETVFTCHFCRRPCVSWGPHLWYQCPSAVWGASCAFASALALLPCDGRMWYSPHHCTVYRGDHVVVWALAHESAFPGPVHYCPCPDVYVTWSGLVHSPRDPPVVLAAERDLAMESYLAVLGAWLVLPPRLRRERLLDATPPDWGSPSQWVAVVLAAAALAHCLGCPLDATSDVAGELLGGEPVHCPSACPVLLGSPLPAPAICHLCGPHPHALPRWCCLHCGVCGVCG